MSMRVLRVCFCLAAGMCVVIVCDERLYQLVWGCRRIASIAVRGATYSKGVRVCRTPVMKLPRAIARYREPLTLS